MHSLFNTKIEIHGTTYHLQPPSTWSSCIGVHIRISETKHCYSHKVSHSVLLGPMLCYSEISRSQTGVISLWACQPHTSSLIWRKCHSQQTRFHTSNTDSVSSELSNTHTVTHITHNSRSPHTPSAKSGNDSVLLYIHPPICLGKISVLLIVHRVIYLFPYIRLFHPYVAALLDLGK